jgi:hypothetical protein
MLKTIFSKANAGDRPGIDELTIADLSPEEFIRLAYLVLLQREIDPVGLASWRDSLSRGMFNHSSVVDSLLTSEEYQRRFSAHVNQRLHEARKAWVRTLPPFTRLLDIGGSSRTHAEGALIQLGYPHRPRQLDILDLPPEKQNWGTPVYDQTKPSIFEWGTVTYFHGSAEDVTSVTNLQGRTYDGIFMGQAIEHIQPEALPAVLRWMRAHLAPGGRVIVDTPNRILTRIQCPTWYIHPDHKLEYEPDQLELVFADNGLKVVKKAGMVRLPAIVATGVYDAREFADAQLLHEDPEECYLFAFEAVAR